MYLKIQALIDNPISAFFVLLRVCPALYSSNAKTDPINKSPFMVKIAVILCKHPSPDLKSLNSGPAILVEFATEVGDNNRR